MCSHLDNVVTVSMPYWGCPRTVRRAVQSILSQRYEDLRLIVVNDGDSPSAWDPLEGIDDARIVRFDMAVNRGRYYADAVVLGASNTGWFAIHDADDWSEPTWLSDLVATATATGSVAAFAPQVIHRGSRSRVEQVHPQLTTRDRIKALTQLAHHAGCVRTDSLRAAGGYHPAYRIGYDTMVVNLVRMIGPCSVTDVPTYHRVSRFGSLTTSRQTGFGSPARAEVRRQLQRMYQTALDTEPMEIAGMVAATIPERLADSLAKDVRRLRAAL